LQKRIVKGYSIEDKRGAFELCMHPERVLLGIGPVKRSLYLFAEQPVRTGDEQLAKFDFLIVPPNETFAVPRNAEFIASFVDFGNTYFLYGLKRGE
jgi:hypothetical protein